MRDGTCSVNGCEAVVWRKGARQCDHHRKRPQQQPDLCTVDGCAKAARQNTVCMMHLYRMRRTGSYALVVKQPKQRMTHSAGYVIVRAEGHVLAKQNFVFEHRLVLFDRIGYGPHRCHWCGTHVNWGVGLEADHVDRDRSNNVDTNLVEACHACNTRRALHRNQYSPARLIPVKP